MNNLFWLTVLVVVESLQFLIAVIYVNTFFPPEFAMLPQILPEKVSFFSPEREMLLYRIFILTAMVLQSLSMWKFRSKLSDAPWGRALRRFLIVETLVLAAFCYVIFKVLVYHHPNMNNFFWPVLLLLSVAMKVFWLEVKVVSRWVWNYLQDPANARLFKKIVDIGLPLFIALVVYLPRQEAVLAQAFMTEQFHHFDTLVMVPTFASSMGAVPNVEVKSQYGVGLPILMAHLTQWMGGVSYAHVLFVLVIATIVYYVFCYVFLRQWLGHALLAAAGIVIFIKWQMFDGGMIPHVFVIPNGLPVRSFWDIFFLMCIWRHVRTGQSWALGLGAVFAGVALAYVSDTGTYLMMAFYAYIAYMFIARHMLEGMRPWENVTGLLRFCLIPLMTAFGMLWMAVGEHIVQPVFWNNVKEYYQFFRDGYETVPFFYALTKQHFLDNCVAILVPLTYGLTLLIIGTLVLMRKMVKENAMVLVICAYGLASYHYHLNRSTATGYYIQSLPYVLVLCFWIKQALARAQQKKRQSIMLIVFCFCMFSLLTTHAFLTYPNALNVNPNPVTNALARPRPEVDPYYFNQLFTRIPEALKLPLNSLGQTDEGWKTEDDFKSDQDLVDYFHKEFDFSKDADLIARLIPTGQPAALLSSFDARILMQAKRKPFFYCFPLLVERPMRMRSFPSTHLHTIARLEKTIQQMEQGRPEFIFIEKIFMIKEVNRDVAFWSSDIIALINYVRTHYEPYQEGYYLVAMKRKGQA